MSILHFDAHDIVVGLDDDPRARAATSWAMTTARASGRRVVLVRVFDVGSAGGWGHPGVLQRGLTELFQATVDTAVDEARSGTVDKLGVRGLVRLGRPAEVLRQLSTRADQVVVGIRPRSLTSRLLLGSVGHHLIRTSPRPVVLVPVGDGPNATVRTERVVVAVGGVTGAAAIRYGFRAADDLRLPLTFLRAAGPTDDPDSDVDVALALPLLDVISEEQTAHPAVVATLVTADDDLGTALSDLVGPHDLLVLGHRVPVRPRPPVVDRLLLPLLRRPHQVVVIAADPPATSPDAGLAREHGTAPVPM